MSRLSLRGYSKCADGFWRKTLEFMNTTKPDKNGKWDVHCTETLVCDSRGRLVKVERGTKSRVAVDRTAC